MEQFYNTWMNRSKYWFNQNDENDKYLSKTFGYLIDEYSYEKDKNPIIGIIIYDQLTRHFYRNEYANHIITYFNRKALNIALLNNNNYFINNLIYNDWMFYMLVYRHTNEKQYILFVMNEVWKKVSIPRKFIKATYTRANFEEELDLYDYNKIEQNIIYDRNILDYNPKEEFKEQYEYIIGDYSQIPLNKLIIVSLSGGVDSMSCLYYLSKITKNLIAVHINYNNRKETDEEVNFLRNICNKLGVDLYVRTIKEIKRQPCIENYLRDIYESYTKKVRYNSYKKAYELKTFNKENPIVILGHNKDDCFENILTNISYNNKYDNLIGIELNSFNDNINFHRPLINVSKNDIYKYAKFHNIPYLKNSTPNWSQRGKIRTMVVPILEQWDNRIIDGLFNLSEILKDLHLNIENNINSFKKSHIDNINNLNLSILYWKYGIFKLFNFYPSNKSLKSLIERLMIWKNKYENLELHKKTKIIINKNLNLLIWKCKNNDYSYILQ